MPEKSEVLPTDQVKFLAKVLKVQQAVSAVQKEGYNAFHKYSYVREEDAVKAVRPHLLEVGLVVRCSQETPSIFQEGIALAHLVFTVSDVETGYSESIEAFGTGSDAGSRDKALYKAITGAKKYFVTSYFMLSSGDDPEADEAEDKRAAKPYKAPAKPFKTTAETELRINELIDLTGSNRGEVDAYAKRQFKYPLEDLTETESQTILKMLEQKLEAQTKLAAKSPTPFTMKGIS
jgi:hypothetical protein